MTTQELDLEEVARKARDIYDRTIRPVVETDDNIGKMVTINVDSGAYELSDKMSALISDRLLALNPHAELFGIRVGYKSAYAIGGIMERTSPLIAGYIDANKAIFPVTFSLPSGASVTIDFVIDTGFAGDLTLPPVAVASLGLRRVGSTVANLADDRDVSVPVHEAIINWDGSARTVLMLATGRRPLLGAALLEGNEFVAQFMPNGLVTLEPV